MSKSSGKFVGLSRGSVAVNFTHPSEPELCSVAFQQELLKHLKFSDYPLPDSCLVGARWLCKVRHLEFPDCSCGSFASDFLLKKVETYSNKISGSHQETSENHGGAGFEGG